MGRAPHTHHCPACTEAIRCEAGPICPFPSSAPMYCQPCVAQQDEAEEIERNRFATDPEIPWDYKPDANHDLAF